MMMMTGGGKLGSMAPVTMTGAGGESLEYKKPATEPKWKVKTLYLTFMENTSIWGIEAFQDIRNTGKVEGIDVLLPTPICHIDMYDDCGLPVGMGLFKFKKKVFLVGGETTSLKDPLRAFYSVTDRSGFVQSSDKVYEFVPSNLPADSTCFREVSDYRLPISMPHPIVANIMGKVYVLHGDHFYAAPAPPEEPHLAFQVLEYDRHSESYHWKALPPPPFYDTADSYVNWKTKMGVLGHRLFIHGPHDRMYIFDARKKCWESGDGDLWPLDYLQATTLSSRITSSGPHLKKTKRSDISQGQEEHYYIAVGADYQLDDEDRVFAAVFNDDGIMSGLQWLPDPLPAGFYPLSHCKVIDLLEEDEQQDDDEHLSSTFCVVYISCEDALALSVFRVSLLAPMVVVNRQAPVLVPTRWRGRK